ncbi:MAG: mechanosensitive ion channel [bacterium]|nr:mechanosensitive ion channel [bacterium]
MGNIEALFNTVTPWISSHGIRILGILLGVSLVKIFARVFIENLIRKTIRSNRFISAEAEKKREDTLIAIFSETFGIGILVLAGLMILSEAGMDSAPLIAGAGIIGLAFGFGGQYLIKDLIAGFFIILENQYRIGDVVCFGDTCGLVEKINLRTTILRDLDGTVHHMPNGEIKVASNLSKFFARVNLNIGIAYNSDLEKVIRVVNKNGIEIPFPQRVIHQAE